MDDLMVLCRRHFDARRRGNVLWLAGELDAATADLLEVALDSAVSATEGDLFLDLSRTSFMGVAAIDPLRRARARLRDEGRSLVIVQPSTATQLLLDVPAVVRALGDLRGTAARSA